MWLVPQNWSASWKLPAGHLFFPLPYLNTALRSCQRRFVYLKPVTVHSTGFGRILTTSNVEWTRSVLSQARLLQVIIPVIIRDEVKLLNFCSFLHHNNVFVNPVFYPVVSKKKSRIRISVTALLKEDELSYS